MEGPTLESRRWAGFKVFYIATGAGNRATGERVHVAAFSEDFGNFRPPLSEGRIADKNPKHHGGSWGCRGGPGFGRDLCYFSWILGRGVGRSGIVHVRPRFPEISGSSDINGFQAESRRGPEDLEDHGVAAGVLDLGYFPSRMGRR